MGTLLDTNQQAIILGLLQQAQGPNFIPISDGVTNIQTLELLNHLNQLRYSSRWYNDISTSNALEAARQVHHNMELVNIMRNVATQLGTVGGDLNNAVVDRYYARTFQHALMRHSLSVGGETQLIFNCFAPQDLRPHIRAIVAQDLEMF